MKKIALLFICALAFIHVKAAPNPTYARDVNNITDSSQYLVIVHNGIRNYINKSNCQIKISGAFVYIQNPVTAITLHYGVDSITPAFPNVNALAATLNKYVQEINTSGGTITYSQYRHTALDTIGQTVSALPCSVYQWNIVNATTVPVYVRLYNVATPTKASTIIMTLYVPASGTVFNGNTGFPNATFSTAFGIRCSTGPSDTDNGEPTTTSSNQLIISFLYR